MLYIEGCQGLNRKHDADRHCTILRAEISIHNTAKVRRFEGIAAPSTEKAAYDVIVIGGGPAGLTCATSLGAAGMKILCLERAAQDARRNPRSDGRTVALSYASVQMLSKAGVWSLLERQASPILDIRVADQASTARLDFNCREVGSHPFGWIVETHLFDQALQTRAAQLKNVEIIYNAALETLEPGPVKATVRLKDGREFSAPLIVAADGKNSACRERADIPVYGWDYKQTAIVCIIRHQHPHHQIAVEHFHPGGPFAVLPMTDDPQTSASLPHRSSIVWTEKAPAAQALMELDEAAFTRRMQTAVETYLGDIALAGKRFTYPLSLKHARRYSAPRLALIGDAAHSIHPIAGQGFNLGIADIAALQDELVYSQNLGLDHGGPQTLKRFEQRRKRANGNMVLATDLLDRLFSTASPPVQAARRFGLRLVQNLPRAKQFFMRAAMGISRG